jgi:phosphatidylglycerophosphate synthase
MNNINLKDIRRVYYQSIEKNGKSEGFFSVFIFRKISILFSWIFASLNIHPNYITTLSFIINVFATFLLLIDFNAYKVIAIFLIITGLILDMCDGEVARLTNRQSKFGAFYDSFLDRLLDVMMPLLIGVGFCLYKNFSDIYILLLMIIYMGMLYGIMYIDGVIRGFQYQQNNSCNKIEKSFFQKYVKWDGGFAIFIYSFAVFFERIDLLFIFLSVFSIIKLLFKFNRVVYLIKVN